MSIIETLTIAIKNAVKQLYLVDSETNQIQVQKTKKEIKGDYTINVFPLLKISKLSPEQTAIELGNYIIKNNEFSDNYNIIKGFLNIEIKKEFWTNFLNYNYTKETYGEIENNNQDVMIEYSSPNTNKPLHLGHIRNNLLGFSISEIKKAAGNNVKKVNLVNDRGIHICKSMLAWQKFGNGETPETNNIKGDKLVGNYYVKFDKEYKKQIEELTNKGIEKEIAEKTAPIILEAQNMLLKWEAKDAEIYSLWEKMNSWVYKGFDVTYKNLGVNFDKIYYESQTYLLGKELVKKGLNEGVLFKKDDGSVWADLTSDGLDQKLLLRADGTSVYMTQDIGTAHQRFAEFKIDNHIYVVGNEQIYHFQVLKLILKKLGYQWADNIYHLSYGMVELPDGKMKSREGTVVDADDLIAEMISTAREKSLELGKLDGYSEAEKENVYKIIALGALKYFILKVDPKKGMMFNPKESIDFNGNTGPFIQYAYARIKSILRKAEELKIDINNISGSEFNEKELNLIKNFYDFTEIILNSSNNNNPAIVANYIYDLVKEFNQFYHDYPILKEENVEIRNNRLVIVKFTGTIIKNGMKLLGIEVPERM
jgi:arginyl-tRNA synthetase